MRDARDLTGSRLDEVTVSLGPLRLVLHEDHRRPGRTLWYVTLAGRWLRSGRSAAC